MESAAFYPEVMGLFCTGYVLHVAWRRFNAWRLSRSILRFQIEVGTLQELVWEAMSIEHLQDDSAVKLDK